MLVKVLTSIALLGLAAAAGLHFYYRRKFSDTVRVKNILADLQGVSSFDQVISVLTTAIGQSGFRTYGFFKKNTHTNALAAGSDWAPVFEKNAASKAFFLMEPCYLDLSLKTDANIAKRLHKNIIFVPIAMKPTQECWRTRVCEETECPSYKKLRPLCWLNTCKKFQGTPVKTFDEKIKICFLCESFLPVGIFAVTGRKPYRLFRFLNDNFSGVIRNAVEFERATFKANTDVLTGIMNRQALMKDASRLYRLAMRYGCLSACMLDIDHFKKFNDTYGHKVGDFVLKTLAATIAKNLRNTDIVARYGGEEFTILLPDSDKGGAIIALEKIRKIIEEFPFVTEKGTLHVTISMGYATYPEDKTENIHDLLDRADIALYQAKITRNRVVAYDSSFPEIRKTKEPAVEEEETPKTALEKPANKMRPPVAPVSAASANKSQGDTARGPSPASNKAINILGLGGD